MKQNLALITAVGVTSLINLYLNKKKFEKVTNLFREEATQIGNVMFEAGEVKAYADATRMLKNRPLAHTLN